MQKQSQGPNVIFAANAHYLKHLLFTVTNDLTYDQRMRRICTSLAGAGYLVTLVGRLQQHSAPLESEPFQQHRLCCWFNKGKMMYLEYNFRLLIFLLFKRVDLICAIDLDTIFPVLLATKIRNRYRVYDAHELFTEQKEIVTRPGIYKAWLALERFAVPAFIYGYTVNKFIADELYRRYQVRYQVVRNMPVHYPLNTTTATPERFIIYQGAVNEGRSFETLIPAMKDVPARLVICGEGNFYNQAIELVKHHGLQEKVALKGYVLPKELAMLTPTATLAVMLFENVGMNQYHSLANRFFDYIMAGVPQVCVDYPEYRAINNEYGVAYLVANTEVETIATALNNLLSDGVLYDSIKQNCLQARDKLNWQSEEKVLIEFYRELFNKKD